MPAALYPASRRTEIIDGLLRSLHQTEGISKAAYTDSLPLTGSESRSSFKMRQTDADSEVSVSTLTHTVSHDYFAALGIRIVEGRGFTEADSGASPHVVVVNRAFAQKYLGSTPVGARLPAIGTSWQTDCEVIGIAENVMRQGIGDDLQPALYLLQPQTQVSAFAALVIRVSGEPRRFIEPLNAAVKAQDASLALESVMTMEDRIGSSLARPRLYAVILGGFAVFALIIAGVGLFGVLSYSVAQRSTEIAVRTAVGAKPLDIACLILKEAFGITVSGLVIGIGSALVLVSYLSTLLYGVRVYDPLTFVSVPFMLCVITLIACALPSLRAMRIDPIRVMRGKWVAKN
jgi:predicted permease